MSTAARCPLVRRSLFRSSVCAFSGERALHERPVVARSAMLSLKGMCVRCHMVAVLGNWDEQLGGVSRPRAHCESTALLVFRCWQQRYVH